MADHFEKAKDEILLDAKENGGVEPRHIFTALCALAADQDDACTAATKDRKRMKEAFTVHCVEARAQLDDIDRWRDGLTADLCQQHKAIHDEHIAEMHALGVTDEDGEPVARRVWFMWLVGSKVVYVLIAVLLIVMDMAGNVAYHWFTGD